MFIEQKYRGITRLSLGWDPRERVQRPILAHVAVERLVEPIVGPARERWTGLVIATDGHCLGVVPVELHEADVPGMLYAPVLEEACRLDKANTSAFLGLDEEVVTPKDGIRRERLQLGVTVDHQFPDWRRIIGDWEADPTLASMTALNAALLARVQVALGGEGVHLEMGRSATGPMMLRPVESVPNERSILDIDHLVPPYGLMMPMAYRLLDGRRAREAASDNGLSVVDRKRLVRPAVVAAKRKVG